MSAPVIIGCMICAAGVIGAGGHHPVLAACASASGTLDACVRFGTDQVVRQMCRMHRDVFDESVAKTEPIAAAIRAGAPS